MNSKWIFFFIFAFLTVQTLSQIRPFEDEAEETNPPSLTLIEESTSAVVPTDAPTSSSDPIPSTSTSSTVDTTPTTWDSTTSSTVDTTPTTWDSTTSSTEETSSTWETEAPTSSSENTSEESSTSDSTSLSSTVESTSTSFTSSTSDSSSIISSTSFLSSTLPPTSEEETSTTFVVVDSTEDENRTSSSLTFASTISTTSDSTSSVEESSFTSSRVSSSFVVTSSSTVANTSSTETIPSGWSTVVVTETNPGNSEVFFAVEGTVRFAPEFSSIKNQTLFSQQMADSMTSYFGAQTEIVSLRSGSIIVTYLVITEKSNVNSIISLINSLSTSKSFAGYEIVAATSAAPQTSAVTTPSSSNNGVNGGLIGAVVGGVAGAILLSAIIIAIVLMKRRKNHDKKDIEKGKGENATNVLGGNWNRAEGKQAEIDSLRSNNSLEKRGFELNELGTNSISSSAGRGRNSDPKSWQIENSVSTISSSNAANNSQIFLKNIQVHERLGFGKFGDVYKATWNRTTSIALKAMKNVEEERSFINEVALLMRLNHPNVVRALGLYRDEEGKLYLAMEYLSKGSLLSFLRKPAVRASLHTQDLVNMSVHVAAGMNYLEDKKIIHRDLAARNLLVTEIDGKYIVKIADLGLSRESSCSIYQPKGDVTFAIRWAPPEVIESSSYSHKSDVWSFAVSLWEIFEYGGEPYHGMSNVRMMDAVISEGYRLTRPLYCPESIYEIMLRCWSVDPQQRPSFEEIWKELNEISSHLENSNSFISYPLQDDSSLSDFMRTEELDFLSPDNRAPTPLVQRDTPEYIRTFDDV